MSEQDEEELVGPSEAALQRMQEKIDHLPTLEGLLAEKDPNAYTEAQLVEATAFVEEIIARQPESTEALKQVQRHLQKKHRKVFKKSLLLQGYRRLCARAGPGAVASPCMSVDMEDHAMPRNSAPRPPLRLPVLEDYLVSKAPRSQSGVLVVTVFTSAYPDGQRFSCQWNCYYCPNEPGQPRSYLLNEPGVRRANRLDFDPYRQFVDRVRSLVAIGHPADKVELLVLGGTWESYPTSYRHRFMRDLFFAANTVLDPPEEPRRPPLDLPQEQLLNETAACRIIGVTLETRPDTIHPDMLVELRRLGCTRVQLGVQHTDDGILTRVNRQATREDTMRAIKLLKDSAFKVDIHLMPDLPGATPAIDKAMFDDVLDSPYLQADQWKIYPCQTTPFTVIEQWYKEGTYCPYGLESLVEVILHAKRRVHPWIRLNRVIRDIPVDYVLAGVEVTNLRQLLALRLRASGEYCRCIRCREVKGDGAVAAKLAQATLRERTYAASEGTEVFLSLESPDERTIFGFLRLRMHIREWETPFPELLTCALIRELHVYGHLITTHGEGRVGRRAQHTGIGSRLMEQAEALARRHGYTHIAVISGIGVRDYYRRKGYHLWTSGPGGYLIKDLRPPEATVHAPPTPPCAAGEEEGEEESRRAPSQASSGALRRPSHSYWDRSRVWGATVLRWWREWRKRGREATPEDREEGGGNRRND